MIAKYNTLPASEKERLEQKYRENVKSYDLALEALKKEMTNDGESSAAGKSGPCGRGCKLCSMMRKDGEVEDKNGEKIPIEGDLDCRTGGAVYGIWCKKSGKIVSVGQTKKMVKEAHHYLKSGHTMEDMRVVVLAGVVGKTRRINLKEKDGG